jgi:hypothetical protein
MPLGATAVRAILIEEGFARLPRRLDEERPVSVGPTKEAVADVRDFVLSPREFTTRVGGLFLFLPDLVRLHCNALAANAKLPGSQMIPAAHALRAALALKLWSIERKSHVMALVADEGLGLFCGLTMPEEELPLRVLLAHHPAKGLAVACRLARRAGRGDDPQGPVHQSRLPQCAVLWGASRR